MRGGRHFTKPVHRHSSGRSWTGDARLSLSEQAAREPAVPRPPIIELDMDGIRIWILARSGADASDGDHRRAEGSKVIGSTGAVRGGDEAGGLPQGSAPRFVVCQRRHQSSTAIFVLSLLLGWIAIGWIVAFVWASAPRRQRFIDPRYIRG
jgi:Superinfection immunity protein